MTPARTAAGPSAAPKASAPAARTAATAAAPAAAQASDGPAQLSRLQASLTGGRGLPPSTRQRMEAGFGRSFADVRVHTDAAAAAGTRDLQAEAFTVGGNIAFAPGQFRPGTAAGDRLIAHELAHVVQQRGSGGAVQAKSPLSSPGEAAEAAADRAAEAVVAGRPAAIAAGGLSLRGRIMRRARAGVALRSSSALSLAPPRPGGVAPGSAPVLTPSMTSSVSPAGGRMTGLQPSPAPGGGEASVKTPDEAQTASPEGADGGTSPRGVMVAGAPAGGAEPEGAAGKRGAEKRKQARDRKAGEAKEKKKEGAADAAAKGDRRAGGAGGGGRKTKKFGRNLGDRGAGAAAAAKQRLTERSSAMQVNEGAGARIGAAREAAQPPPNAAEAAGQQQHAAALEATDVPPPDTAGASQRAAGTVRGAAPSSIEDLETFAGPGGAAARSRIGQSIAAEAEAQTGPVRASLSAVENPPPGPAPPPAVPEPEPLPAADSAAPEFAAATPPPVPDDSLDASEFREEADDALAEHDVDQETLDKADEGPLREIGNDKNTLNDNVAAAADRARGQESAALGSARSELATTDATTTGGMAAERQTAQAGVTAEQDGTRTGEEVGEQTLADRITGIYQRAEQEVSGKLGSLQSDAVESFRTQQSARLEAFSSGVRSELEALKRRRYAGARGRLRKLRDWVLSLNSVPEVKALYERHRDQYIRDIDQLLATIRADIDRTVAECKATLAAARTEIDDLVASSGGELDQAAQAALDRAREQFTQMESRIETAATNARQALDRERTRAIEEMDRALDEIRAENAGLVERVANAIRALAQRLGQFMALMARITRMGIGTFLGAALGQARDGVQNNLWDQLQEAFKQWIFMKLPVLQLLLNMPPNWMEMLTALSTSLIGLFTENLPAMLPAIGVAAMSWLAVTLAAKLIPGVGAIMAVIDALRGAWALVQSLFTAAAAFFEFVMKVAERAGGAGVAFARALAFGIIAAVDAILTFLGVDRLIRRVVGAIARPFGRIIRRIQSRFQAFMARRRQRRRETRDRDSRARERDGGREAPGDANRRRGAEDRARRERRADRARDARRDRDRDRADGRRRESPAERRRRQQQERDRRNRERLDRAVRAIQPKVATLMRRGVSRLGLAARLAFWRVRYRLSSLERRGDSIIASVNPSTPAGRVAQLSPQRIGRALEPILREAERQFERERMADPQVRQESQDLERQMRAGQQVTAGGSLNEADVVFAARRFMTEPGQLPLALNRGYPSRFFTSIQMPGRRRAQIRDLSRTSMMLQEGAPSYAGFQAGHLTDPNANQLLDLVEPTRAPGQLATRAVTRDLVAGGRIDPQAAASGQFNPMAPVGASVAADQDFRGRRDSGSFSQAQVTEASRQRQGRTGAVFQRLDRILTQQTGSMQVLGDDQALRQLAQAFRQWALTNVSRLGRRQSTPAERTAAEAQLIASLVAFLRSRYP